MFTSTITAFTDQKRQMTISLRPTSNSPNKQDLEIPPPYNRGLIASNFGRATDLSRGNSLILSEQHSPPFPIFSYTELKCYSSSTFSENKSSYQSYGGSAQYLAKNITIYTMSYELLPSYHFESIKASNLIIP